MIWEGKDISNLYENALEYYKIVMTAELAERMAQDYHVSDGPDIEMARQDEDGTWYKLSMIKPSPIATAHISEITVNNSYATAVINRYPFFVDYIYRTDNYDYEYHFMTFTVELECIDGEWKFSGGSVFDYLRNYAETSPYTGDESNTAVIPLAAGAVVSALISMTVFIRRRRKRKFEV